MEDILKEARSAVKSAFSMIDYYEKDIQKNQKLKANAIERANSLKKQFNEMLKKLGLPTEENFE
jgi:hypothetical protein